MKKIIIIYLLVPYSLYSQNIGIGTSSPTEKLDVHGNLNLNGTIKANGVAGQPGQILTTNTGGKIQWANNPSSGIGYNNFIGFYGFLDSVETWTVPNGVSRVSIEAWGGGGSGSLGGGGGGGGYVTTQFNVNAGTVLTIRVGSGGVAPSNLNTGHGQTGGTTIISVPDTSGNTWYVVATGGAGAYNNPGLSFISSYNAGGSFYVLDRYPITQGFSIYPHFMGEAGESGYPSYYTYIQVGSTTFLQESTGGRGGDAGNSVKTGGGGARNLSDNNFTIVSRHAGYGGTFGGGGGAGMPGFSDGRNGGKGKVIIWY